MSPRCWAGVESSPLASPPHQCLPRHPTLRGPRARGRPCGLGGPEWQPRAQQLRPGGGYPLRHNPEPHSHGLRRALYGLRRALCGPRAPGLRGRARGGHAGDGTPPIHLGLALTGVGLGLDTLGLAGVPATFELSAATLVPGSSAIALGAALSFQGAGNATFGYNILLMSRGLGQGGNGGC
jgi:hypothetical protein